MNQHLLRNQIEWNGVLVNMNEKRRTKLCCAVIWNEYLHTLTLFICLQLHIIMWNVTKLLPVIAYVKAVVNKVKKMQLVVWLKKTGSDLKSPRTPFIAKQTFVIVAHTLKHGIIFSTYPTFLEPRVKAQGQLLAQGGLRVSLKSPTVAAL